MRHERQQTSSVGIVRVWTRIVVMLIVFVLLLTLAGCATPGQGAARPVVPSVLRDAPPDGSFQMRLHDFLNLKQDVQMSYIRGQWLAKNT